MGPPPPKNADMFRQPDTMLPSSFPPLSYVVVGDGLMGAGRDAALSMLLDLPDTVMR